MTYILNIIFRVCIKQVLLHVFATNGVTFFLIIQTWRGRKRQARGHQSPSSIQGERLAIDDKKITFQHHCLLLAIQQQTGCKSLKPNIVFIKQKVFLFFCVSVSVCVFVVSQFDLSITEQNYLFVRCQSLSHIANTSLRC